MAELVWDKVGEKVYETGLDRGVLYLPDGSAVPWNGLTSIIESFDKDTSPVYFDGMKISELVVLGDFAASMKAVTYPEEFLELESLGIERRGIFYGDQPPQYFGLCYRTQIGNDFDGDVVGHKINILYNVMATPKDKTYATMAADPNLVEFEWSISAVPEEIPGFRPTAHIIIDSRTTDPWLLEELEGILYGDSTAEAALIPMADLITYISEWYRIKIIDHGDGTWSAMSRRSGLITIETDDFFTILQANAIFLDDVTFEISDTLDIADVPDIKIIDNGDGTWSATTTQEGLFTTDGDQFEIINANATFVSVDEYQVSDTT